MHRHLIFALWIPACATACSSSSAPGAGSASAGGSGATAEVSSSGATEDPTGDPTEAPTGGTTGGTTGDPLAVPGCDGGAFLPVPEDTSLPGPWPVGARTVSVDGLTVEVWYPAAPGSDAGQPQRRYDVRDGLPAAEQGKVSDADNPWQDCDCHGDLPLDVGHGPYPVVLFVHGTAGFRSQSLEHVVHWASRGFIVLAADHPGLWLKDLLGAICGAPLVPQDLGGDLGRMRAALQVPGGDLEFLAGHVDADRIGMAGHSAGGNAISGAGATAQVLIPMAAGGVEVGPALRSALILGAMSDQVVAYANQQAGYADSPAPRRLVGIAGAGHLAFSSLCSLKNAQGQNFLEIATEHDVCGAQFASVLFDCEPEYTPDAVSWEITRFASSAVLESVLRCTDAADNFATIEARFPEVGEYQESL